MQLRFDEALGLVYLDGVAIHLDLVKRIADPNKHVLWRFEREGDLIVAKCYTEDQVIWTGDGKAGAAVIVGVKP